MKYTYGIPLRKFLKLPMLLHKPIPYMKCTYCDKAIYLGAIDDCDCWRVFTGSALFYLKIPANRANIIEAEWYEDCEEADDVMAPRYEKAYDILREECKTF